MQQETVPRNPWPSPTRSRIPFSNDWKSSRRRSLSTWDALSDEDHTHHLTAQEYFHYKNKWWLHSNKQGSNTMSLRHRSYFKQALSTLQRLPQAVAPNVPTYSYKQWQLAEFIFYMVELARFMVVQLQFTKSRKRWAKSWVNECDPLLIVF